jgi:nucleoid DNA-binding protein
MNKSDLINGLVKVTGTKKDAEATVNSILGAITKALKKGDKVTLGWFWHLQCVQESRS